MQYNASNQYKSVRFVKLRYFGSSRMGGEFFNRVGMSKLCMMDINWKENKGKIIDVISTDGYYSRAEIVKVACPACGEVFIGTKRHAGGFVAGHRAFHEFENDIDVMITRMGGQ